MAASNSRSTVTTSTSVPCGCPSCCFKMTSAGRSAAAPIGATIPSSYPQQPPQPQPQQQWMNQWSPPAGTTASSAGFGLVGKSYAGNSSAAIYATPSESTVTSNSQRRGRKRASPPSSAGNGTDAKMQRLYPTPWMPSASNASAMQQQHQQQAAAAAAAAAAEAAFLFQQAARRYPLHHVPSPANPWSAMTAAQPLKFHC